MSNKTFLKWSDGFCRTETRSSTLWTPPGHWGRNRARGRWAIWIKDSFTPWRWTRRAATNAWDTPSAKCGWGRVPCRFSIIIISSSSGVITVAVLWCSRMVYNRVPIHMTHSHGLDTKGKRDRCHFWFIFTDSKTCSYLLFTVSKSSIRWGSCRLNNKPRLLSVLIGWHARLITAMSAFRLVLIASLIYAIY